MMQVLINHWRALQRPMMGLGIGLMIVFLLMGFAGYYERNQDVLLNNVRADYESARKKLQLSKQEQQDIEQYLPHYQRLLQLGFIGEEQRHAWIARLHQVAAQHQLFTINYEIGQQAAYDSRGMLNVGLYKMQHSVMTLSWGLLHEEDFIHLLSGLREGISPFMVQSCEIVLLSDRTVNDQAVQENLTANCSIDWLTIQDSAVKANF